MGILVFLLISINSIFAGAEAVDGGETKSVPPVISFDSKISEQFALMRAQVCKSENPPEEALTPHSLDQLKDVCDAHDKSLKCEQFRANTKEENRGKFISCDKDKICEGLDPSVVKCLTNVGVMATQVAIGVVSTSYDLSLLTIAALEHAKDCAKNAAYKATAIDRFNSLIPTEPRELAELKFSDGMITNFLRKDFNCHEMERQINSRYSIFVERVRRLKARGLAQDITLKVTNNIAPPSQPLEGENKSLFKTIHEDISRSPLLHCLNRKTAIELACSTAAVATAVVVGGPYARRALLKLKGQLDDLGMGLAKPFDREVLLASTTSKVRELVRLIDKGAPSNEILKITNTLSKAERVQATEIVLGRKLTQVQADVLDPERVMPAIREGPEGPRFTREELDLILRNGLAGKPSGRVSEPIYRRSQSNVLDEVLKDQSRVAELGKVMGEAATYEARLNDLLKNSGSAEEIEKTSLAWAKAKQAEYRMLGYQSEIVSVHEGVTGDGVFIPAHSALQIIDSPNPVVNGARRSTATRVNLRVDPVEIARNEGAAGGYSPDVHAIVMSSVPTSREAAFREATEFRHEVRHAKTMVDLVSGRPGPYYANFSADPGKTVMRDSAYSNYCNLDELATHERMVKQMAAAKRIAKREVESAERAGTSANLSPEHDLASMPRTSNPILQTYHSVAVDSRNILSGIERGLTDKSLRPRYEASTMRNLNTEVTIDILDPRGKRVGETRIYLQGSTGPEDPNNTRLLMEYVKKMRENADYHVTDAGRLLRSN